MGRWSERLRAERTGRTATDRAGARPDRSRRAEVEALDAAAASWREQSSSFRFPLRTAAPTWITTGPDGNLWFTENSANRLVQFNLTTHGFTQFPIPVANSGPTSITTGPDGNLWFIESATNGIGSFNPTTHVFTNFPIPFSQ